MIGREDVVEMGQYNKPHGINGEISATMLCELSLLENFKCLISSVNGIFVPFFIESVRPKNEFTALIKIEGINNEADARLLINKEIYVLKTEYERIAEEQGCDESPADFFIGYSIVDNTKGIVVGKIVDIDDSTDNVLFIVGNDNSDDIYIPVADEFVYDIDNEAERIYMNLPDGLIDANN